MVGYQRNKYNFLGNINLREHKSYFDFKSTNVSTAGTLFVKCCETHPLEYRYLY